MTDPMLDRLERLLERLEAVADRLNPPPSTTHADRDAAQHALDEERRRGWYQDPMRHASRGKHRA